MFLKICIIILESGFQRYPEYFMLINYVVVVITADDSTAFWHMKEFTRILIRLIVFTVSCLPFFTVFKYDSHNVLNKLSTSFQWYFEYLKMTNYLIGVITPDDSSVVWHMKGSRLF